MPEKRSSAGGLVFLLLPAIPIMLVLVVLLGMAALLFAPR